jgi:fumarylacetoacetase
VSNPQDLDETHEPSARSWLESANLADADFPIQNLPFAVFRRSDSNEAFRGGVAIGDQIVDLAAVAATDDFHAEAADGVRAGAQSSLNALMQLGDPTWRALRRALFHSLLQGSKTQATLRGCLVPQSAAEYSLPARIGDYTDFYSSIYHATAVGRMMRPDQPLLPNYPWIPIGYHGRSSSIGVSAQDFYRPQGQRLPAGSAVPVFGPSQRMDYELELGVFIGSANPLGTPIPIVAAESHIFGLCLLNDWSARDLQAWEYQPLGPFLAKNFATTISPWIITLRALAPFRVPFVRPENDPQPLPYLDSPNNRRTGALDICIEALLQSQRMREQNQPPHRMSRSSFKYAYWTIAQLVAHHTVNGCNLLAGDLLGTGTQSGPTPAEAGSLLELSKGGREPLRINPHETRTFLEDGDTVILRGWCEKAGATRIGFGESRGRMLPSLHSERTL